MERATHLGEVDEAADAETPEDLSPTNSYQPLSGDESDLALECDSLSINVGQYFLGDRSLENN
jgi:hypothetical protein